MARRMRPDKISFVVDGDGEKRDDIAEISTVPVEEPTSTHEALEWAHDLLSQISYADIVRAPVTPIIARWRNRAPEIREIIDRGAAEQATTEE